MGQDERDLRAAFGLVIRDLRLRRDVSQEEVAHRAGINRNYYGKLERGQMSPTLMVVYRLAAALDISAAKLLTSTEAELQHPRLREKYQA